MQLETWSTAINSTFAQLAERLAQYLPNLIGAVLLVLLGWIVAKMVRAIFLRLVSTFDRLLHRFSKQGKAQNKKITTTTNILANFVFWIVILFFVTAASNLLQWDIFSEWLNKIITYLPSLLAGAIIILVGYVLSSLLKEGILNAQIVNREQRLFLAKTTQTLLMITVVLIGLDQIGIDVTVLVILFSIITASIVGSVALAVSLGAKTVVSNLIGAHYLRQNYRVGQVVRIGDHQGKIIEISATSLVMESEEGQVMYPASLFHEVATTLLESDDDNE